MNAIGTAEVAEIGAYAEITRLLELADGCLSGSRAELVRPPESGLVMLRVEETVDRELFNLGEVLVTRCELLVDGTRGWATVLGDDRERATATAVLDATVRETPARALERDLRAELAAIRRVRQERWASVQPTRVELEESA